MSNHPPTHRPWPRRWKLLFLAGGVLFLLVAPLAPPAGPSRNPLARPRLGSCAAAADANCTPDCGPLPPDRYPALHRAKHLARLGADRWHAAGFRGKGIKVAILDSGFRGYKEHLGKALPARVLARSFRSDGNLEARDSQHGILCGEVLHALAPEADLLFANWEPDRSDQFLQAVRWAREQGVKVISCSIIMPSWSDGEGRGPVHQALGRLLGDGNKAGDLLCFASAGNVAQRHWAGPFRDTGDGWHAWVPGQRDNLVRPWGDERVSLEMCWSGSARYELSVADARTGREVCRSAAVCEDRCGAVARFQPEPHRTYMVRVRLVGGEPGRFHLSCLGGGMRHATTAGSIPFPGDGPEVIAVGAVSEEGRRVNYSSCGPCSAGPKPDLTAVVPFPSLWRPRPFAGTSAAAPQAAGLAALLWSKHPDWTASQVRAALGKAAVDLGPPGHDCETGYGMIRLPE
ncbi:MAG TPA: S8 family serine peptidase [Gemmataceae bacterium]|nr:S8 family serine peptidase [Gemmataceae bacterium]